MARVYRTRHETLANALTREFADHLEIIPSSAGLHVTALARKASTPETAAVARRAADAGVAIQILASFAMGAAAPVGIVLGYGAIQTGQIEEGLRRLRNCFDSGSP